MLGVCFRVKVEGREHLPKKGPVILASNHRSFLDSIFIPLVLRRRVTFVAKAEYFDDPKTAWFFRGVGQIPIRREGGSASERALASASEVLAGGGVFGIYPEGTRTRDGLLHRGHTGVARLALRTGAPIVPVGLIGTDDIQPVDKRMPRLFRRVTIRFGEALGRGALRRLRARAPRAARAHRRGDVRDRPAVRLRVRRHVRDEEGRGHPDRRRPARRRSKTCARPRPRLSERSQSRERSTARCQVAMRASRSAASIAGVNDASACHVAFTVAGESHTPSAMPARNAAPSAVVSCTAARRTGTPSRSAWNWHSRSMTEAPPSMRISAGGVPLAA